MKLQILVSSLNQEVKSLAEKMNLQADAILINQCNENRYEEWTQDGHQIRCYHLAERGVGLSRTNALLRAGAAVHRRIEKYPAFTDKMGPATVSC